MSSQASEPCAGCGRAFDVKASRCPDCALPRVLLGEYRLQQRLGRGGMASVYAARRTSDGAEVAVKLMRLSDHEDWKARELFERSSKVLRGIEHPQLPRVYAFGELDDGSCALVRERFDGGTLESWITDEHWRGTPAEIRALLESLLGVLEVLHGRVPPVIHRDLKPSNVMFRHGPTRPIARNPPVLVDFDTVASAAGDGHTLVVSPGYTAPEQLAGRSSPASDLYGLGMTMLFVITHREPDALARDDDGRVVLGTALDGLDPGCRRIMRMLIEPDRRARPRSARWALDQLRRATTDEPRAKSGVPAWLAARRIASGVPAWLAARWLPLALGGAVLGLGMLLVVVPGDEEPPTPSSSASSSPAPIPPEPATTPTVTPSTAVDRPLRCRGSLADCDGDRTNGCEADLQDSSAHCGACGHACGPDRRCSSGECLEQVIALETGVYGHCEQRHGGALWCGNDERSLQRVELPHPVISFDADRHRCAVTEDGALYCWGANGVGQAGTGSGRSVEPVPVRLEGLEGVTAVSLGRHTGCAVAQGQAWCWGSSLSFAVTGSPKVSGAKAPIRVRRMDRVDVLRSGLMHVCVIRQGAVWCWGDGRGGATGDPARPQGSAPTLVAGIDDAVDLALGRNHTCALRSSGAVACWGSNGEGQLGTGTHDDSFAAVTLELLDVVQIASDQARTCARTKEGGVLCWGGAPASVPTAVTLPGLARFITMDYDRLVAILADGRVIERRVDAAAARPSPDR